MTRTPSNMLALGTKAPDFTLPDAISGKSLCLQDLKSSVATVIFFICNHCPYVIHIIDEVVRVAKTYQPQGIAFVAINANDILSYPEDAPEYMTQFAKTHGFSFPYLFDETQLIAKAYQAACTPDFYVFDKDLKCVYRGQFDDARPKLDEPVTGYDLRNALSAILMNKPVSGEQKPSLGCNIKWR